MRWIAPTLLLCGCNAIFGLAPTGLGDDAAPDAIGGTDATPPGRGGSVVAFSRSYAEAGVDLQSYSVTAGFGHIPPSCGKIAEADGCVAFACDDVADLPPWPEAGEVSVESSLAAVAVPPGPDGSYPEVADSSTLFDDGAEVWFYAAGGTVPAFSTSLFAPTSIDFLSNALPTQSEPIALDRTSGLTLAWTAAASGTLQITITPDSDASTRVQCAFPVGDGSARLESTVLLELPTGPATMTAIVVSQVTLPADPYAVTLSAVVVGRRLDGGWVNGTAFLQ